MAHKRYVFDSIAPLSSSAGVESPTKKMRPIAIDPASTSVEREENKWIEYIYSLDRVIHQTERSERPIWYSPQLRFVKVAEG